MTERTEMDLIIEGHPTELEWLRREIEKELGPDAELEAVPAQDADELREPIIISLIVALGGPVIVEAVSGILQRRYQHKEEMQRLDVQLRESEMQHEYDMTELRLQIQTPDGEGRPISESELEGLAVR
jgi:hypothetical protein